MQAVNSMDYDSDYKKVMIINGIAFVDIKNFQVHTCLDFS